MSILTKQSILENKQNLVLDNVDDSQISQNSVDLSLGEYIFLDGSTHFCPQAYKDLGTKIKAKNGKTYFKIKLYKDTSFGLYPGMFVLAYSHEWFGTKPNTNLAWQFLLKSTAARNGLDHNLAGFVETGYFSPLCFELYSHTPVELKYGDLIGQAVLHTTTDKSVDYSLKGSYQNTNDLEKLKKEWKPENILPKPIKNKFNL